MAKAWIKAEKQFTRRIGRQTVVGHPKHPETRGRVAEVEEGEGLNNLISGGYAKRITRREYLKELGEGTVMAGENQVEQVAGRAPKASITMTDGQLDAMAAQRGVARKDKQTRADFVKAINAKEVDVAPESMPDNAFARTAGESRDSTSHPQSSGIHADVTEQGTTDRAGISKTGVTTEGGEEIADADDDAPSGSGDTGK